MIKLTRGPEPDYLKSEKILKEKYELGRSFEMENRQERLRFNVSLLIPVRKELLKVCNHKCAYCESKVGYTSHPEIENFRPKAGVKGFLIDEYAPYHYWWLAYEWENLLISCQMCNKLKGSYFPLENESRRSNIGAKGNELLLEKALLLDPFYDNPSEHLSFKPDGFVVDLSHRGKVTIEVLQLNRSELVERRRKTALLLITRLQNLESTLKSNQTSIKRAGEFLNNLTSDNPTEEYVGMQREIYDEWLASNTPNPENVNIPIISDVEKPKQHLSNQDTGREKFQNATEDTQISYSRRFSIKKIEIENFKSIEKLSFNIKPTNDIDGRESWLLLLGDNGIGKSSILQAIALCLISKNQLDKLDLDPNDYLRRGKRKGKVVIYSYERDTPITLIITKDHFISDLEEAPTFVLAYGSTRLMPKGKLSPDENKEPYLNVRNLFDYSTALSNPTVWLNKIDTKEFNERVAPAFYDVLALRGEDRLYIEDGIIKVKQNGENHDLEDNSDGYKTITALVSDIMQTLSVEKADFHNAQGIVLIDEIGNHLHPRWRLKIAGALRKTFPKLQFIVTTHEPLCLRGLTKGEVVVLVRDNEKHIKGLEGELLPDHTLMTIEQLLTSDLFGLINILDEETEKTYEEYYALLSKKDEDKTEEDKVKIEDLSLKLNSQTIIGNNPKDQIFYKVIDETLAKKIHEEGFKTKKQLTEETVKEVKGLLKSKKIDWL